MEPFEIITAIVAAAGALAIAYWEFRSHRSDQEERLHLQVELAQWRERMMAELEKLQMRMEQMEAEMHYQRKLMDHYEDEV